MTNLMQTEPVLTVTGIGSVIGAVIALLVSFGVHLSADQTATILGLWAAIGPIVLGTIARRYVTPVKS